MGKHERGEIKKAEKIIVKILNEEPVTSVDRENLWFSHVVKIAETLVHNYPNIILATHLGDTYENAGDISLKLDNNKTVVIEVKMSETKTGVGTKANMGQDSLTKFGLFIGNVISWSQFRESKKHTVWVRRYLNIFKNYPSNFKKISTIQKLIETQARYLRDNGNEEILTKIQERDRSEKIKYLKYLKQQKQNCENIKKFYILLMLGIHKEESISDLIKRDNLVSELENLIVYYSNFNAGNVVVTTEDVGGRIVDLVKNSVFEIEFPSRNTHCLVVRRKQSDKIEKLLQIAFHWKNVAQGIQTPCLNIFDLHSKSN
ncbi:MAG: hypothetical protein WCX97_04965 [Candidatus Magasanikbacteria bacterium]